jgi:hypothetical protein
MKGRWQVVVAVVAAVVLVPATVWAAAGSFSSASATPGVTGSNSYATGKGVAGYASSTSASTHVGVYGNGSGSGGVGLYGVGSKFGVYSTGPIGIVAGKQLVCSGCVTAGDISASAKPSVVIKDGSSTVTGSVGNVCTNLDSITIVPGVAGKVTVDVDLHLSINHTNGADDWFQMVLAATPTDCTLGQSFYADRYINGSEPTGTDYKDTLHLSETFAATAGSHTYYVNVKWPFGGDGSDSAARANLRAMFFPG